MDDERHSRTVRELVRAAERLEELADTAELMGDDDGAERFRGQASQTRLVAMDMLDPSMDRPPGR